MRAAKAVVAVCMSPLLVLPLMFAGGEEAAVSPAVSSQATLSGVPAAYSAAIVAAGSICPEVTPQVIAAQLKHESSFDPSAVSSAGAQGIAQFMPGTWESVGVDGDGDGDADPFNPLDAIATQGRYMCGQVQRVKLLIVAGSVVGDPLDLALAAYNAGLGSVVDSGGVPSYTVDYVEGIKADAANYVVSNPGGAVVAGAASADGLLEAPGYDASGLAPETMTMADPTPGAHGLGMVTPRTHTLATAVQAAYPQFNTPALYCYDAHEYNPASDHSKGRACDIPAYACDWVDPDRSGDPVTGALAGNALANWLVANAPAFGVHYVIWRGRMWDATTGRWDPYDGAGGLYDAASCSGGHYDHIHVSVY